MNYSTTPTGDQIDKLKRLSSRGENVAYFFDRLNNPSWVIPLAREKFFSNPPVPEPAETPGYLSFPAWPEGRYLARMAEFAPIDVANVLLSIDTPQNPAATLLLFEAAGKLPYKQLKRISKKLLAWIDADFPVYFSSQATGVAIIFLENKSHTGLGLLSSLLEVLPDPRTSEQKDKITSSVLTREASGRISTWEYARVLDLITSPATRSFGIDAVTFFSNLLNDALTDEESGDEYSYIWRPAVEQNDQNNDRSIRDHLVSALVNSALMAAAQSDQDSQNVLALLDSRGLLHRRIYLHVLANIPHARGNAQSQIRNRSLLGDPSTMHEYSTLLKNRFNEMDLPDRDDYLSWVAAGPDLDPYLGRVKERGHAATEEEVRSYVGWWQRDRYSLVVDWLDKDVNTLYMSLIREFGEPVHPTFASWSVTWSGDESPISSANLAEMKPHLVADYLKSWTEEKDATWNRHPTIGGLAAAFGNVVKDSPQEYSREAGCFESVPAIFISTLYSTLANSVKDNSELAWSPLISLALKTGTKYIKSSGELAGELPAIADGWQSIRQGVVDLFHVGLQSGKNQIPFELRDDVWSIIGILTEGLDVSVSQATIFGDPLTTSLNTSVGQATHTAVEYALWVKRNLEAGVTVSASFEQMPEVQVYLDQNLSLELGSTVSIRAIYGRWLPWLFLLDQEWSSSIIPRLFPGTDDALRNAAWDTYISWCRPYDSMLENLFDEYIKAIEEVPTGRFSHGLGDDLVDSHLGEHLATYYWRGHLEFDTLKHFMELADDTLRAATIQYASAALANTEEVLSSDVRDRFKRLWQFRLESASENPDGHKLELRQLSNWFASGQFEASWVFPILKSTIEMGGAPKHGHPIVEHLVKTAKDQPLESISILAMILEKSRNNWDHIGWDDEARAITKMAIASGDKDARTSAERVVDFYVKRGVLDFRDLLIG